MVETVEALSLAMALGVIVSIAVIAVALRGPNRRPFRDFPDRGRAEGKPFTSVLVIVLWLVVAAASTVTGFLLYMLLSMRDWQLLASS